MTKFKRTMNMIYRSLVALATISSLLLLGCKKEDEGPMPTEIDATSITATPGIGKVKLTWTTPQGANYKYVQVTYHHPGTNKQHMRMASVHADTLLVDGLKNLYGPIEFTIRPVTKYGKVGAAHKVTATAEVIPIETRIEETKLLLSADGVWVNDPDPSEGIIAHIVDGRDNTFYHSSWRGDRKPLPGYVVIDMKEDVGAFSFRWRNRHDKSDNPKILEVWASQTFDKTTFNPENFSAVQIETLRDLPSSAGSEFVLKPQFRDTRYRYLWFKVNSTTSNATFFTVAEITINKCRKMTYNPETEETIINE